nr:hypothetical protein [Phytohabitans rumicis]
MDTDLHAVEHGGIAVDPAEVAVQNQRVVLHGHTGRGSVYPYAVEAPLPDGVVGDRRDGGTTVVDAVASPASDLVIGHHGAGRTGLDRDGRAGEAVDVVVDDRVVGPGDLDPDTAVGRVIRAAADETEVFHRDFAGGGVHDQTGGEKRPTADRDKPQRRPGHSREPRGRCGRGTRHHQAAAVDGDGRGVAQVQGGHASRLADAQILDRDVVLAVDDEAGRGPDQRVAGAPAQLEDDRLLRRTGIGDGDALVVAAATDVDRLPGGGDGGRRTDRAERLLQRARTGVRALRALPDVQDGSSGGLSRARVDQQRATGQRRRGNARQDCLSHA